MSRARRLSSTSTSAASTSRARIPSASSRGALVRHREVSVAHFASTAVTDRGGGRYEIAGELSIKGIARPIVVPVTLRKDATGNTIAEGTFALKRLDFKVGTGQWGGYRYRRERRRDSYPDDAAAREVTATPCRPRNRMSA
jgi:hypothetical protein